MAGRTQWRRAALLSRLARGLLADGWGDAMLSGASLSQGGLTGATERRRETEAVVLTAGTSA